MKIDPLILGVFKEVLPERLAGYLSRNQLISLFKLELEIQGYDFTSREAIIIEHKGELAFTVTPNFQINNFCIWIYRMEEVPENQNLYLQAVEQLTEGKSFVMVGVNDSHIFINDESYEIPKR